MISKDVYTGLCQDHSALAVVADKVQELIRDELEPGVELQFAEAANIYGSQGVVCVTDTSVYGFWTQTMFFFFKFPAVQKFHLNQIRKVEATGPKVYLRAEADPSEPDNDYEENDFQFSSTAVAEKFVVLVSALSSGL